MYPITNHSTIIQWFLCNIYHLLSKKHNRDSYTIIISRARIFTPRPRFVAIMKQLAMTDCFWIKHPNPNKEYSCLFVLLFHSYITDRSAMQSQLPSLILHRQCTEVALISVLRTLQIFILNTTEVIIFNKGNR